MKYAITAATGKFGKNAVKELSQLVDLENIVAIVRNPEKAQKLLPEGIEIRQADYSSESELSKALSGVDRLLFISSQPGGEVARIDQHRNVVNAAKSAGVKFVAYTSFPKADVAKNPLASDHRETEKLIKDAGFSYSFLRNNWYLENEMGTINGALNGNPFVYSAGDGKAGWTLERNYSEAAAKVLASDNTKDIYEFAGTAITYGEMAKALQEVSGVNFDIEQVSDEQYTNGLKESGLDEGTALLVTSFQTMIREGGLDGNDADITEVLGRSIEPLSEQLKELIK
ncbi:SDR family oxidoreductase [Companilactobacillus metriopterae]|uniref:SDR family oxidoreductase n=1 Tax=Companilactobacillus metriopterae TaxID=1909267 RepID=UPI00100BB003|nr:SDR family oxidoreductase [Companilactobacillus metriopterae]